jgi:hypothetical protein
MKPLLRVLLLSLLVAGLSNLMQAADAKTVQTEARILLSLNHFPNDADKKALQAIIDDKATTAEERTVAQALMNVQHKVSDADKPKLQAIVDDKAAPESLKTISGIILSLNHAPTAADKDKLQKLVS